MIRRVLVGGTASGKKQVAAALHERHGLSLLSMDALKVYRGMDIGTDKPGPELLARAPFELLDLVGHDESFSAGRWVAAAVDVAGRSSAPLLFAGGTPLYLRLLLRGLFQGPDPDPVTRAELESLWDEQGEAEVRRQLAEADPVAEARLLPADRKRLLRALEVFRLSGRSMTSWQQAGTRRPLEGEFLVCALRHEPQAHAERIARRAASMLDRGLLEEVANLRKRAAFAPEPARSIGYAEALAYLDGHTTRAQLLERISVRTRQLVRKQRMFITSHAEVQWIDVPAGAGVDAVLPAVEIALRL